MIKLLQPPAVEVAQRLLVKPSHEPEYYQWVHIENTIVRGVSSGTLEQLAEFRRSLPGSELIFLLPAGEVALRTVAVTDAERKLYRQMLPYAMEEGLIEPTEDLHFAFKQVAADAMGVALVRRKTFQALLDEVRAAGLSIDIVMPETLLLPWSEQKQTWTLQGDQLLARTGPCRGFVAPLDSAEHVAGLPDADGHACVEPVLLVVEQGSDGERAAAAVAAAGRDTEVQQVEQMLAWEASVLPDEPFNMLQGDFQPPLRWRQYWRDWKPVAVACLAALLLNYVVLLYHYSSVKHTAEELRAEKQALARKAIPTGKITSPERQMRAALTQLSTSGPTNFGSMLATVGPALGGESGYAVRTINYDGSTDGLRLEVRTKDFQQIEQFRNEMQQRGIEANLLNSSAQGEGILARLELKEAGR